MSPPDINLAQAPSHSQKLRRRVRYAAFPIATADENEQVSVAQNNVDMSLLMLLKLGDLLPANHSSHPLTTRHTSSGDVVALHVRPRRLGGESAVEACGESVGDQTRLAG
jgi:hypothetical protein